MAKKEKHWAEGRLVAIRPDGARRSFDPVEAAELLRSDGERDAASLSLQGTAEAIRRRGKNPPAWLEYFEQ